MLLGKGEREFNGRDLRGELDILENAGFIRVDTEDCYDLGPAGIGLRISEDSGELASLFVEFVVAKKLNFRSVIGAADLSGF